MIKNIYIKAKDNFKKEEAIEYIYLNIYVRLKNVVGCKK